MTTFEDELEAKKAALDKIIPARPKTKQAVVDAMADQIDDKLKCGATFTQIRDALFPDLALTTFKTMLYRARKKKGGKND